ncbi:hypothetical protein R6Z07F_011187 [Ovis aries]
MGVSADLSGRWHRESDLPAGTTRQSGSGDRDRPQKRAEVPLTTQRGKENPKHAIPESKPLPVLASAPQAASQEPSTPRSSPDGKRGAVGRRGDKDCWLGHRAGGGVSESRRGWEELLPEHSFGPCCALSQAPHSIRRKRPPGRGMEALFRETV